MRYAGARNRPLFNNRNAATTTENKAWENVPE
jgi:hypothetical protein